MCIYHSFHYIECCHRYNTVEYCGNLLHTQQGVPGPEHIKNERNTIEYPPPWFRPLGIFCQPCWNQRTRESNWQMIMVNIPMTKEERREMAEGEDRIRDSIMLEARLKRINMMPSDNKAPPSLEPNPFSGPQEHEVRHAHFGIIAEKLRLSPGEMEEMKVIQGFSPQGDTGEINF